MTLLSPTSAYTYGPQAARNPALEVLMTDGQGGFATSSLAGVPTSRYSGLVVSQQPPVQRYNHFVSPLERLEIGEESIELHALETAPGVFSGRGLDLLTGATVWDLLPEREQMWRGTLIRRRACMPQDSGALVLLYEIRSRQRVTLNLGGFFVDRDMHAIHHAPPPLRFNPYDSLVQVQSQSGGRGTQVRIHLRGDMAGASVLAQPLVQAITPKPFTQKLYYRADAARGETPHDHALGCELWSVTLPPGGGEVALVIQGVTQQASGIRDPWSAFEGEMARRRQLAERAWQATGIADEVVSTLAIAADAYLVRRAAPPTMQATTQGQSPAPRLSVIAGYPWFSDWGRDAMVALSGLTLVTGRPEDAQELLASFLSRMKRGLLPNAFDEATDSPIYNTVDASLWLAVSLERYARTTGDALFVRQTLPLLREMIDWYVRGTEYGIGMDPEDGLLLCGEEGMQLTWMDVKIQDWVVTPRHGKPVEIQALWLASLGAELRLSQALGEPPRYAEVFERAHHAFRSKFWNQAELKEARKDNTAFQTLSALGGPLSGMLALSDFLDDDQTDDLLVGSAKLGTLPPQPQMGASWSEDAPPCEAALLADVVSPTGEPDFSLRPNGVIALSLADTPVVDEQLDAVIAQTERELLTPVGLRSLAACDPRYLGNYGGHRIMRDAAYHQGTVWAWPLAGYIELLLSRGEINRARATLAGLTGHIWEAGIGHVSEVFSGDTLEPGGCPFQAWSVAELLRAHVLVSISERQRAEEQHQQGQSQRGQAQQGQGALG